VEAAKEVAKTADLDSLSRGRLNCEPSALKISLAVRVLMAVSAEQQRAKYSHLW
jgi:hypothetical protein